ncbi:MAG: ABC transporter ATP-binding protein [Spirochaetales bacterium]|nr:ABC transporter ATP-binding protein [Spirochaetales bacterium]
MIILKAHNIKKQYSGEKEFAIQGLHLELEDHTIFGYLGPNGAGKTTTIKIMIGLMKPTTGEVFINNLPVSIRHSDFRKDIGYLAQSPLFYPHLTGHEFLEFTGRLCGMTGKESRQRAGELLTMSGMEAASGRRISTYSGGMIQRLGIAQALMNRPKLLFLDEPVSSLDPIGRKEVLEFIRKLKQDTTVFMSTHILEDVERICDHIGIINQGRIITMEKTSVLKEKYAPPQVTLGFETPEDAATFMRLMQNTPWASFITREKDLFVIKPEDYPGCRQAVLKIILDHNLAVSQLRRQAASLEDIFVRLIGGDNATS